MTEASPFALHAAVSATEQPGVVAGARLLSGALARASGQNAWPLRVTFGPPGAEEWPEGEAPLILSLSPEAPRTEEPIERTAARWRAYLQRLQRRPRPILLVTIFRHVNDRAREGRISPLAERIRRLNRLAVDLSHEMDAGVIDVDRAFSYIGAWALEADYRLAGGGAAEAMGRVVAWSLLSYGLDSWVDPLLQERAKTLLGGLDGYALHVLNAAATRRGISLLR